MLIVDAQIHLWELDRPDRPRVVRAYHRDVLESIRANVPIVYVDAVLALLRPGPGRSYAAPALITR